MTAADRPPMVAALVDGASTSAVLLILLGGALLVAGWVGVVGAEGLQTQVAYVVSGGLAGTCLVGAGCALAAIQVDRYERARVSHAWSRLAEACDHLREPIEQPRQDRT